MHKNDLQASRAMSTTYHPQDDRRRGSARPDDGRWPAARRSAIAQASTTQGSDTTIVALNPAITTHAVVKHHLAEKFPHRLLYTAYPGNLSKVPESACAVTRAADVTVIEAVAGCRPLMADLMRCSQRAVVVVSAESCPSREDLFGLMSRADFTIVTQSCIDNLFGWSCEFGQEMAIARIDSPVVVLGGDRQRSTNSTTCSGCCATARCRWARRPTRCS